MDSFHHDKHSKAVYLPYSDELYEPLTQALVHYMRYRFGFYWNDWHWTYQKRPKLGDES